MDKALKQRLTGAIILIALAIIFLPMLVDGERQQKKSSIELPDQPVVNFPTRRLPIGQHPETGPSENVKANETAPIVSKSVVLEDGEGIVITPLKPPAQEASTTKPQLTPAVTPADEPSAETESEISKPPAFESTPVVKDAPAASSTAVGQWQLQVASFAGQSNAEKLVVRLRHTGYQANIDSLIRDKTTLYRVLVPGYPDRSAAELAANSIRKQIEGVNPKVIAPDNAIEELANDEIAVSARWVIQMGSFSQFKNAEALAQELRQSGYTVINEQKGNIHKVFVGPLIDADKALKLRNEIFKKLNIKGLVKEQN